MQEVCGVQGEGRREGKGLWELYFVEGKVGKMPLGIHRMLPFARQGAAAAVRESRGGGKEVERQKLLQNHLSFLAKNPAEQFQEGKHYVRVHRLTSPVGLAAHVAALVLSWD